MSDAAAKKVVETIVEGNDKNLLTQESKLVQMRLQPKTLQRLQDLVELTSIENRTQLVSSSIQLTEEIMKSIINDKAKVYIESPDGKRELLRIVGL